MKKVKVRKKGSSEPIKVKRGHLLVMILKANKSYVLKWVHLSSDSFSVDGHTYFIDPKGSYIDNKGVVSAVYFEGASLPIHHGALSYEIIKAQNKTIKDSLTGRVYKQFIPERKRIKDIKYDSGLIDMLLNRKLADVFTKVHLDLPNLLLTILLIVTVGVGFVNIGLHFI